jgi:hypothetical protein
MGGFCVGQGFQPHVSSMNSLIKKLEAKANKWQVVHPLAAGSAVKGAVDVDAALASAWKPSCGDDMDLDIFDDVENAGANNADARAGAGPPPPFLCAGAARMLLDSV